MSDADRPGDPSQPQPSLAEEAKAASRAAHAGGHSTLADILQGDRDQDRDATPPGAIPGLWYPGAWDPEHPPHPDRVEPSPEWATAPTAAMQEPDGPKGTPRSLFARPVSLALAIGLLSALVAFAVGYLVDDRTGSRPLGTLVRIGGIVVGAWLGGKAAGVRSQRDWSRYLALLVGLVFAMLAMASCVIAIAEYG